MSHNGWNISRPRPAAPFLSRIFATGLFVLTFLALATFWAHGASCAKMQQLAQEHSNDMAARRSLDHRGFEHRARRGARAENVALASSREGAMRLWRASPPHAANMALPGCRAVANSGRYWTMEISQFR